MKQLFQALISKARTTKESEESEKVEVDYTRFTFLFELGEPVK